MTSGRPNFECVSSIRFPTYVPHPNFAWPICTSKLLCGALPSIKCPRHFWGASRLTSYLQSCMPIYPIVPVIIPSPVVPIFLFDCVRSVSGLRIEFRQRIGAWAYAEGLDAAMVFALYVSASSLGPELMLMRVIKHSAILRRIRRSRMP
jgi:hypothetical protein